MEKIAFEFNDEFQLGIFEIMLNDLYFCGQSVSQLKPEYFKNEYYAFFFNTIKKLYEESNSVPSKMQLMNEILKIVPEKQEMYFAILKRIYLPKFCDHFYIKTNLTRFCKKASNFHIYETLRKNTNQDPEFVHESISKMFEDQRSINFNSVACQTVGQLTQIMEKSADDVKKLIPTFMPKIDKALDGGVPRGTLTVGLSGTNVGKSIWLINWAYHLIKNGYKVFYVNLEGFENQTILRLASRAIGCTVSDVRHNRLNDLDIKKRNAFEAEFKDKIQIYHNATFDFKFEDLIPIARQKKSEFDFDVMIIDYVQIMKSKKTYKELRHEQSYTHRGISSLCAELDVAGVTVAQGNRETQEKNNKGFSLIRMDDISECFEITRAAATVVTLNRSDADKEMDLARVLLDKQRDGQTGVIEICKTNFSRMAFYGDQKEGLGYLAMDEYVKGAAANVTAQQK